MPLLTADAEHVVAWLRTVRFCDGLDSEQLAAIASECRVRPFVAGETLASAGDEVTEFWILVEGELDSFLTNPRGREEWLGYDTTRRNGGRARHPGESADSSPSLYCADPWHAAGCAGSALARVGQVLSTDDAEPVSHAERALQTRGRCGGAKPAVAAARNRRHVAAWLCAGWSPGSALARGGRTIASLGRPAVELDVDGELARRLAYSRTRGKRYSAVAATCARRRSANRGLVARLQRSDGIQATTRMRRGAVADRTARRGECEPGPSFA